MELVDTIRCIFGKWYTLGQPGILLMSSYVPILILSRAPIISGAVTVYLWHISSVLFSRSVFSYYFTSCELFTSALAGDLSLETKWLQVSSGHPGIFKYSGWSPLVFNSSSPSFKILGTVPSAQSTIGITATLMFHKSTGKNQVFAYFFAFSCFLSMVRWSRKI